MMHVVGWGVVLGVVRWTYDEAQQVAEAEAAYEADQPLWCGMV